MAIRVKRLIGTGFEGKKCTYIEECTYIIVEGKYSLPAKANYFME